MIDFLKYRWLTTLISIAIIGSFFATYVYRVQIGQDPLKLSVDFTGGTQALYQFEKSVSTEKVKEALSTAGWPNAVLRSFAEGKEVLVRVKAFASDSTGLAARMKDTIIKAFPDNKVTILGNESVGQTIGSDLRWRSLLAILLALLVMLIYIVVRFRSIGFALGAVVALFHDTIAILAVFMFSGLEVSVNVVMAILAILGYSINDTIVIFSQIRKNMAKMKHASLKEIVNVSINQMLRRTLLTSLSTGLAATSLLVIGGEALRSLSIALLVGIIFGTYSSIYIASPAMMLFTKKQ